jgi:hypothetical protein
MTSKTVDADPILSALECLGLLRSRAKSMLAEAQAANPHLSPIELAASIASSMNSHRPFQDPPAKPVRRRRPRRTKMPLEAGDLRTIVARGQEAGLSAYDALLKAGVIKPPLEDFPL